MAKVISLTEWREAADGAVRPTRRHKPRDPDSIAPYVPDHPEKDAGCCKSPNPFTEIGHGFEKIEGAPKEALLRQARYLERIASEYRAEARVLRGLANGSLRLAPE